MNSKKVDGFVVEWSEEMGMPELDENEGTVYLIWPAKGFVRIHMGEFKELIILKEMKSGYVRIWNQEGKVVAEQSKSEAVPVN